MYEHHRQTLEKLVEKLEQNPSCLAVITSGSVAQGTAKETSDVDVHLVFTDDSYAEYERKHLLSYVDREVSTYEGGYADIKVVNLRFVELAAERGNEPTRYAFTGSEVVFSRIPELGEWVARIPVYPEENRERNLRDFCAQIFMFAFYFAQKAARKNDAFLLAHTASSLVFFSGRMILAYNRMLFPSHKGLLDAVEAAEAKPQDFRKLATELLQSPGANKCKRFAAKVLDFYSHGLSFEQALGIYVQASERSWMEQPPSLQDR
ncbi:nucleotidyltransferase domain-containing protein [Paenibacillus tritici]|uniref:Nucleotidyltransferase domain-containing protein n=1 Tax=Paenibacillus tritici TaxID=1873425 RepID=A0ABX2DVJ0_9BACL|nr:nucleotidyltransferase domain-containing protein [Paenibacillus tritici]NQX48395.1 nucleotidyltransferase domain-containing protein [Paenibacillus tritici]QUL55676.1 nucleotidyltransferase domain-containing protein [Paenibacillus tritici]